MLTDDELYKLAKTIQELGGIRPASRELGISRTTLQDRYHKACGKWPALEESNTESSSEEPTPSEETETEIRRLRSAAAVWEERAKDATRERDLLKDQIDTATRLAATPLASVKWKASTPAVQQRTTLIPMLLTSDFQCGEVIKPEEIDGLNAYNKDIFAERYCKMIDKTIDISDHHTGANVDYPGIYYLRNGDAVSGGIHDELRDTDDLSSIPAIRWLLQHEREGIKRLRDRFGRVKVISTPGNHGRQDIKPRHKSYAMRNFETLLAWWLASSFADDPNVEFMTPPSGEAMFKVFDWNILMVHGDRMGSHGGRGFIGPIATIARGHQKLYQNWATRGKVPNLILTGHLHVSCKTEHGYGNGSTAGFGEFARDIQAKPDAAKQWLFYMHEQWCVSQARELILSDLPRNT